MYSLYLAINILILVLTVSTSFLFLINIWYVTRHIKDEVRPPTTLTTFTVFTFLALIILILTNVYIIKPTTQTEKSAERVIKSLYTSNVYNLPELRNKLKESFDSENFYKIDPENIFNISQRHLQQTSPQDTEVNIISIFRNENKVCVIFDVTYKGKTQSKMAVLEVKGDKFSNYSEYIIKDSVNYD